MGESQKLLLFILITAFGSLIAEAVIRNNRIKKLNKNKNTKESFITYLEPMSDYCKPKMVISEKKHYPFNTCQPAVDEQNKIKQQIIVNNSKFKQIPGYGSTSLEYGKISI